MWTGPVGCGDMQFSCPALGRELTVAQGRLDQRPWGGTQGLPSSGAEPWFPLMSSATPCPPRDVDDDRERGDAQRDDYLRRIRAQPGPPQGGRVGAPPGCGAQGVGQAGLPSDEPPWELCLTPHSSPPSSKAGDTVGVVRREDGTLHFFVNGMTQGPAAWNVPPGVYAVVDLYGQAAQATIVDDVGEGRGRGQGWGVPQGASETTATSRAPSPLPEVPPVPEPLPEGNNQVSPSSPSSGAGGSDLRFHQLHGSNAVITNGGRTALRHNCRSEFNDAIVISNRSVSALAQPPPPAARPRPPVRGPSDGHRVPGRALRDGELFEIVIQKMVDRWSGSIEAGEGRVRVCARVCAGVVRAACCRGLGSDHRRPPPRGDCYSA